jgi:hypothetical protein
VRLRRLALLAAQKPTILGLLAGTWIHSYANEPGQRLAAAWSRYPERLEGLDAAIRRYGPPVDLARALRGEFVLAVGFWRHPRQFGFLEALVTWVDPKPSDPAVLRREGWPPGVRQRAVMVRIVEEWARAWKEVERRTGDPMRQEAALRAMAERAGIGAGRGGARARRFITTFFDAGLVIAPAQARDGAPRGLIAALRASSATGKWPPTFAAAGFDEADPFGRPYALRASGDTAVVYSFGSDGKDDGGGARPRAARFAFR